MQETWLAKIGQFYSQNGLNEEFMKEIGSQPRGAGLTLLRYISHATLGHSDRTRTGEKKASRLKQLELTFCFPCKRTFGSLRFLSHKSMSTSHSMPI